MSFIFGQGVSKPAEAVLLLGIPSVLGLLYSQSPLIAALSLPVLSIPVLLLWSCANTENRLPGHLNPLVWAFLAAGTLGFAAVSLLQATICYAFASILFGDQVEQYYEEFGRTNIDDLLEADLEKRAAMASDWRYILFLLAFTFIAAGGTEELMKYIITNAACQSRANVPERDYIRHAVATSLGFSVFENLAFIYTARNEDSFMLGMTVVERLMIAMPAHALSGYLIAVQLICRGARGQKLGLWQILALPVFYHGLFDFLLFADSAANGNVGWIHPKDPIGVAVTLSLAMGVLAAVLVHVRVKLKHLGHNAQRKLPGEDF